MIFDLVYERWDGMWVHLTIAIHQHADLITRCNGIYYAGLHRSTVAEIVWQPQDLCTRSFCQHGSGIRRAVINDEQICARIQRAHFTDDCADILSLVIGRYDDDRSHGLITSGRPLRAAGPGALARQLPPGGAAPIPGA